MADNPIDLNKIFAFNDTTPLDQVIAKTQQLNSVLETMLQTAQKSATGMTQSMQAIQKSVESLEAEVSQADATTKKGQDTISQGAATTAKAVAQNEEYKKSIADLNTTIKTLQEQIDKLSDSNKKIPKDNETISGSLTDLKKQLKDAQDAYSKMGDATDSAIKNKALKNIADLNKAVQDAQRVINDAKKGVDIASGSYNDLALKVANATKQLKAMEGGVGSNSQQFKDLQKFISEGNDKLKAFDESIGINTRNVGGYREAIEKAVPAFKQLNPMLVEAGEAALAFGKKALTLLLNPVVAIIAAIVAGLALMKKALDEFTEGTIQGADRANTLGNVWSTIGETVTGKLKEWGKAISDFMESTLIMLTQIIPMTDAFKEKLDINTKIAILQNELKKEEIKLTVESAKVQLEKEEELNKARDKANRSLQERYEALQRANILIKEEISLKTQSAQKELEIVALYFKKIGIAVDAQTNINELFKNQALIQKKDYEFVNQLAVAQKKLIDLDKEQFEGARRRQMLENQLLEEQVKLIQDEVKEERDAQVKIAEQTIQSDQAKNARILANQSSTLEQRFNAELKNAEDSVDLNEKQTSDELFALREKGLQEIILDKKTNDEINKQAGTDLKIRAQLILDAKNKEFDINERFQNEVALLTEAGRKRAEEIYLKSGENIVKIVVEFNKQIAEAQGNVAGQNRDEALMQLNESLKNRALSLRKFAFEKEVIEIDSKDKLLKIQQEQIKNDLAILKQRNATIEEHGKYANDILQKEKELKDNALNQDELVENKRRQLLQQTHDLRINLAQSAEGVARAAVEGFFQYQEQRQELHMKQMADNYNEEIALAGNNQAAKAAITKEHAENEKRAQKELLKLKRKQAEFERDAALVDVAIKTGQAVAASELQASVLASNPLTAALAPQALSQVPIEIDIGAAQAAIILAKPLPQYFTGTPFSKEGFAFVAERGPELAIDPSGKTTLFKEEQIAYLNEGTKILNNIETEPILQKMDSRHMDLVSKQFVDIGIRDIKSSQTINQEVISRLDQIKEVTKKNKPQQVNYAKVGSLIYEFKKEEESYVRRIKALSMGSWL